MSNIIGIATRDIQPDEELIFSGPGQNVRLIEPPGGYPFTVNCSCNELTPDEAAVVNALRRLTKSTRKGGVLKVLWDGRRVKPVVNMQ